MEFQTSSTIDSKSDIHLTNDQVKITSFEDNDLLMKKIIENNTAKKGLARKKSVTFLETKINQDIDMSEIHIITDSNDNIISNKSNNNSNYEIVNKTIVQLRRSSLKKQLSYDRILQSSNISSFMNKNDMSIIDKQNEMKALQDISAELVNYVLNNAIKIVINERKNECLRS